MSIREGPGEPQAGPKPPPPEKPKRASLPKGWGAESLTLERALDLLGLPRKTLVGRALDEIAPELSLTTRLESGQEERQQVC